MVNSDSKSSFCLPPFILSFLVCYLLKEHTIKPGMKAVVLQYFLSGLIRVDNDDEDWLTNLGFIWFPFPELFCTGEISESLSL